MAENVTQHTLSDRAAYQLANVTKTPPQYGLITPRWLVRLLDWKPLEAGTLRVNRVVNEETVEVACGGRTLVPILSNIGSYPMPNPPRIDVEPVVPGEYANPRRGAQSSLEGRGAVNVNTPGTSAMLFNPNSRMD